MKLRNPLRRRPCRWYAELIPAPEPGETDRDICSAGRFCGCPSDDEDDEAPPTIHNQQQGEQP